MKYGYAKGSDLSLQQEALQNEKCDKILQDIDRKILEPHDVIIVWKIDRLGLPLKAVIELIDDLTSQSIGFKSIKDIINTTTSLGRLFYKLLRPFLLFIASRE
jgi:DNA invertase Pin-like site-specific DNA recombinase